MNPIKLIRKLGKVLRGGATQRDMFLSVLIGLAIGMLPGVNLTVVALILLLLLLNTNGGLAMLSIIVGKALCLILAPVTFNLGYWMIHGAGLVGVVRATADMPVLALLDLHVYSLIGALPLIAAVGGPLAWFVSRSVVKMRVKMATATAGSEKFQKFAENKFYKVFVRIVFGKQTETFQEMADKKTPLIRKERVIVAAVVVLVLLAGQLLFMGTIVKAGLESFIAAANGAEVNIDSASLSLGSGQLVIEGLQVTDAARPTHNTVQAERIVAKVSISDLLAKRFVADLIECQALRLDKERTSPGEVYRQVPPPEPSPAWSILDKLGGSSAEYLREIKKFNERLQKLRDYLESDEPTSDQPDKDELVDRAKAVGYLKLSAKDYLAKHPTWVIRQIIVSKIELRPDLPTFTAEGKNLSSHPSLYGGKAELSAKPDDEALKAFLKNKVFGGDKGGDIKSSVGDKLKGLFGK